MRSIERIGVVAVAAVVSAMLGVSRAGPPKPPKGAVHSLPAAGRSYEILVPPGDVKTLRDLPLVIYLHGSKSPRLDRAKTDYWPLLAKRRCLLALPRSKGEKMWLAGEEKHVMDVLADVQTRYSVDAKRIILLGVSGGGQVALFLADRLPERFRALIVISANPVVVRGSRHGWFYPNRKVLKKCPYFVISHITRGSSLMYWRQVRAKLARAGASISILPVTGRVEDYQPPPKELGPWLDVVLAGKHPAPLPDPQKQAVAKMFAKTVAALPEALASAAPAKGGKAVVKDARPFGLAVRGPANFERSKVEGRIDSTGRAMTQIRLEHKKWPIYLRCDGRSTAKPMREVLAAEEAVTKLRGMLYQVYKTGRLTVGGRAWKYKIGSITYPDRRRGWVSTLFIHAAAPVARDQKRWLSVLLRDETQQPAAKELAVMLKTVVATLKPRPAPPATTAPAGR